MENQNDNQTEKKDKRDWHKVSKKGTLIGKFLVLLFLLCLIISATLKLIIYPYSIFVVGLEISLAIISAFTIIRMSTFKPMKPYNFDKLKEQKEPIKLLLTNIDYDIGRYEEGSSYYFNGVRFYKYSTIILAGISTIILGLDFSDYGNTALIGQMRYTTFAKNIALIIGATITVTTALMTYWNIEKYWLTNKTIVNKLRALRDDIESDFVAGKLTNDEKKLQEKIDDYRNIKGDFYKYWEGALADRGSQSGQGNTTSNG
jgi:hypothetical protein